MKIVLAALNSKYIHTNLAIRYLNQYVKDVTPVEIIEFTINQTIDSIVGEIFKRKPDILGISTYIWNIEYTLKISEIIKRIHPDRKSVV